MTLMDGAGHVGGLPGVGMTAGQAELLWQTFEQLGVAPSSCESSTW